MPRYSRLSMRDTLLHNKAVADAYAQMAGVESAPFATPIPPPPKKRVPRVTSGRTEPRERVNLRAIIQLLRTHPKVYAKCVYRMQSGLFREGERYIKVGVVGIPDILFVLRNGRLGACEVKAKGGAVSPLQAQRIADIRAAGGLAFVAWSVDDVLRELQDVDLGTQWSAQR